MSYNYEREYNVAILPCNRKEEKTFSENLPDALSSETILYESRVKVKEVSQLHQSCGQLQMTFRFP